LSSVLLEKREAKQGLDTGDSPTENGSLSVAQLPALRRVKARESLSDQRRGLPKLPLREAELQIAPHHSSAKDVHARCDLPDNTAQGYQAPRSETCDKRPQPAPIGIGRRRQLIGGNIGYRSHPLSIEATTRTQARHLNSRCSPCEYRGRHSEVTRAPRRADLCTVTAGPRHITPPAAPRPDKGASPRRGC
jgi:hypothetical protein